MKKLCNNEVHQFKRPAPWDDKKEVNGAHWIYSEEYALNHDGFELFWHTPGVMDGGEYVVIDAVAYIEERTDNSDFTIPKKESK